MLLLFIKYLNFCLDFFLFMWKNRLIRRLRLDSKFMTSQTGEQMISIHILPNISRSKGCEIWSINRTEHKKYFFPTWKLENEAERLQTFFCCLRKLYIRYKQVVSTWVLIYFDKPRLGHTRETDMLNFD